MVLGSAFFIPNALGAEFSKDQICKGAISVEMYQDVGIMTTVKSGDAPQVTYVRKMDGDRFLYRCKFSGDRVIWSPFFGDNQSWGRWRDGEYDAVLTYKITDGRLSVHSTETNMTKLFEKREFK
jgi:hypothetical protein